MRDSSSLPPVRILNGRFAPVDMQQTVDWILNRAADGGSSTYVCTVNVAILMMMRSDRRLQRIVDGAGLVVADGTPLLWAARLLGHHLPERVTGVDLVTAICRRASEDGVGVYLLGAHKDVIARVADRLQQQFPSLKLTGVADGYFNAGEARNRAQAVADSGAKILIVGMGVPRQEHFIEDHLATTGVQVAIGVGGSFDVIAGLRKRAPAIMQRAGLEWTYRLVQEPRRLFWRYLTTNSQFLYLVGRELLKPGRKVVQRPSKSCRT